MHVAVVGAGSLGRIYGVCLATHGVPVTFVVRRSRLEDTVPFVVEDARGGNRRGISHPVRSAEVPLEATVILLAVRVDQIDDALERTLRTAPPVPVVSLTPLLPISRRRVDELVAGRCFPALPSVAGTLDEHGVVRYRVLPRTKTLVESQKGREPAVVELVEALDACGIAADLSEDVGRRNPATTVAFFPLSLGLSQAGSAPALVADRQLLDLSLRACTEAWKLAQTIGPVEPTIALARFAGPRSLKALVAVARRFVPEALTYLERHFGQKLQAQHRAMAAEIEQLAAEQGIAMPAFAQLARHTRR